MKKTQKFIFNWILTLFLAGSAMLGALPVFALTIPAGIQTYSLDHPNRVESKYIIQLKNTERAPQHLSSSHAIALVAGMYVVNGQELGQILASESQQNIEYIEAAVRFKGIQGAEATAGPRQTTRTNDPGFDRQWGFWDANSGVFAEQAWTVTTGSPKVIAAVIDSGIKLSHPDLEQNIWRNRGEMGIDSNGISKSQNGVDDDGNGKVDDINGWDFINSDANPDDDNGHGSHVAGIIGAKGGNEQGIAGLNHSVSLMALKTFDVDGYSDTAANTGAISYAAQQGASVINASWGGGPYSRAIENTIQQAKARGVVFVAAAGNRSENLNGEPTYPCTLPVDSIICVGASTRLNERASFSNYGNLEVDIAAPGEDIYSTYYQPRYKELDGTSMAAPFVTGAVALLRAYKPELSTYQIKEAILQGGANLAANQADFVSGKRLSIAGALKHLGANPTEPPPPTAAIPAVTGITVQPSGDTALLVEFGAIQGAPLEQVEGYLAAVSNNPISSEPDWQKANRSNLIEIGPNLRVRHFFTGLLPNSRGFVTMRAKSKNGSLGPLSVSVPYDFNTNAVSFYFDGDDLSNFSLVSGWSRGFDPGLLRPTIEHSSGGQNFAYLELPTFALKRGERLEVDIELKHSYINTYDAGYLESKYGQLEPWAPELVFLGKKEWHQKRVVIEAPFYLETSMIHLRFKSMIQSRSGNSSIAAIWVYKR